MRSIKMLCALNKEQALSKSEIVGTIKTIVNGAEDMSGNKVINVLAKHNEYVIYDLIP